MEQIVKVENNQSEKDFNERVNSFRMTSWMSEENKKVCKVLTAIINIGNKSSLIDNMINLVEDLYDAKFPKEIKESKNPQDIRNFLESLGNAFKDNMYDKFMKFMSLYNDKLMAELSYKELISQKITEEEFNVFKSWIDKNFYNPEWIFAGYKDIFEEIKNCSILVSRYYADELSTIKDDYKSFIKNNSGKAKKKSSVPNDNTVIILGDGKGKDLIKYDNKPKDIEKHTVQKQSLKEEPKKKEKSIYDYRFTYDGDLIDEEKQEEQVEYSKKVMSPYIKHIPRENINMRGVIPTEVLNEDIGERLHDSNIPIITDNDESINSKITETEADIKVKEQKEKEHEKPRAKSTNSRTNNRGRGRRSK